jgi:hypothetical protein
MHKYANLGDTVYFWFGANTTAGSGGDGASAVARVRLAGAAAAAAPVLSPTPTLLAHASYPDGCYEVAVAATEGNGFAAGNEYAVFCTLAIDSQNPTGFIGSFTLDRQQVDVVEKSNADLALTTQEKADAATAIFAKTGLTAGGAVTFGTIVKCLYALARGKVAKSGDAYIFYDDDGTTPLFTLTVGAEVRTPS